MSDIVERLHAAAAENAEDGPVMHEAADEIERLRKENEQLIAAYDKVCAAGSLAVAEEIERLRKLVTSLQEQIEDLQRATA